MFAQKRRTYAPPPPEKVGIDFNDWHTSNCQSGNCFNRKSGTSRHDPCIGAEARNGCYGDGDEEVVRWSGYTCRQVFTRETGEEIPEDYTVARRTFSRTVVESL